MRLKKGTEVNSADRNGAVVTTDSGQLYVLLINELVYSKSRGRFDHRTLQDEPVTALTICGK